MKTIKLNFLIFSILFSSSAYSQLLNEKILLDNNGYLYVVAQKDCPNDTDIVVIKYNASTGIRLWDFQSEIPGSNYLRAALISGNYIFITGVNHTGQNKKALIIRCDPNGSLIYNFYFQPGGNYGNAIAIDNSNNIFIGGRSDLPLNFPKFLIVKYNSNLDSLWSYRYSGAYSGNFDEILSMSTDNSGNAYATGYTSANLVNYDSYDYLTIKLNPSGNLLWANKHDGPAHKEDIPVSVVVDSMANSYISGYSYNLAGCVISLLKYNANGDSVSTASYSCPGSSLNYPTTTILDASKNLYVTGHAQCGAGSYTDYITLKYDSSLSLKWYKYSISSANSVAYGISYINSHVYVTGESDSANGIRRFLTLKYDASNGNELFRWYVSTSDSNYAISITTDNSENTYVAGYSTPDTIITARYSSWTNKYFNCQPFGIRKISGSIPASFSLSQNYPNPFNPVTIIKYELPSGANVKLTVFDVNGKEVTVLINSFQEHGTYSIEWDASGFSSGVYFYSVSAGDLYEAKKMLLIK